ncbi:hypothetical protein [Parasitella parasitica]|uniref:Tetraspanin Tsp2 n=1 Tax=Parasitella parasitica TaxID=35722 RepID=A0A0B7N8U3_9FUNG|nr:hypothetical protein [Parasitella parasitica]
MNRAIELDPSVSSTSSSTSFNSTGSNSSSSRNTSSVETWGDNAITRPHLPWMRYNNISLTSSTSSDIHIMKRHVPEGSPSIPVKQWRRWTGHKLWLTLMNSLLFAYGLITLILGLCTYFKLYHNALVFLIGQYTLVNMVTAAGVICLLTSLIGFAAIILNNRPLLTVYNLLMWLCLGMIAAIGYTAYRKSKWNIEGKLSYQWHYKLDSSGRASLQANLHCCGYKTFSDYHERSNKCYPRTLYPGCKYKYQNLTIEALRITWTVAFSMIPIHILVLFSALLCSNHVNEKFGKGLPPKLYHVDYKEIIAASPRVSSVRSALRRDETDLHRRHT